MKSSPDVTVQIGDGVATLKRTRQSKLVVAVILGFETNDHGEKTKLYLDRLVHYPNEHEFIGWSVSGAVSSILIRCIKSSQLPDRNSK